MADFLLVLDVDPRRRRQAADRCRTLLPRLPGLVVGRVERGPLSLSWAHGSRAPASRLEDENSIAVLLGYALDEDGQRLDARRLAEQWVAREPRPSAHDGYFVGIAWAEERGLVVGGDPFGMFPIYIADTGESEPFVVASTPQLVAAALGEGSSGDRCDPAGLAGILLTNGLIGGATLLRGVRRLPAGSQLAWTPAGGFREQVTHQLRAEASTSARTPMAGDRDEDFVRAMEETLREAIRRHAPATGRAGIMLSGGLDSRLMAAMTAGEGACDRAITLGRKTDFEVRAAARVAKRLRLADWCTAEESAADVLLAGGRRLAHTECLAGGFSGLEVDAEARHVGTMAEAFWSGFAADDILGGYAARYGRSRDESGWSSANFFTRLNRWGLAPDICSRLLADAGGPELVAARIAAFCREYETGPGDVFQQSFRMKLATRVRYHIGSFLHRISFHAWPLVPMLDRKVVQAAFAAPVAAVAGRALEWRLLARVAPQLARIPFDTNSFRFESRSWAGGRLRRVAASIRRRLREAYWSQWRGIEPRRYARIFDLDGPGWTAIRAVAERNRDLLPAWIDRSVLATLVPPAVGVGGAGDPFARLAAARTLLGLQVLMEPLP